MKEIWRKWKLTDMHLARYWAHWGNAPMQHLNAPLLAVNLDAAKGHMRRDKLINCRFPIGLRRAWERLLRRV